MMAKSDQAAEVSASTGEDDKDAEKEVSSTGIKFGPYSWVVLGIILGIRILYQW